MNVGAGFDNGRGSVTDLWRLQRLAEQSLVVSATRKCPLSCAHCITSSGPQAEGPVLNIDLAKILEEDLAAMADDGLAYISFTGGEPILALDALVSLTQRCRALDIRVSIVTSGVWAETPERARRVVERIGPGVNWDFGVDSWHGSKMPYIRIDHALTAIAEVGGQAVVRFCEGEHQAQTLRAAAAITKVVRERVPIMRQSVRRIGRASDLVDGTSRKENGLPRRPCVSTGLFVRADGSTGPCCSGLAYEARGNHPFDYGNLTAAGDLFRAWRQWHTDPLLRMIRLATLAVLEGWIPVDAEALRDLSAEPCEACVAFWSRFDANLARDLRMKAGAPEVMEKLDALEYTLAETYGSN